MTEFHVERKRKDGHACQCKTCAREKRQRLDRNKSPEAKEARRVRQKTWRASNPEFRARQKAKRDVQWAALSPEEKAAFYAKQSARLKKRYAEDPVYRQQISDREKARHAANPQHRKNLVAARLLKDPNLHRKTRLAQTFGLSWDDYTSMLEDQNGCCAICNQPERAKLNGKLRALAVDHDHETNAVRELLCSRCNNGIGCFSDNVEQIEKALAYVKKHKACGTAKANVIQFPTPSPVTATPQICPTPKSLTHSLNR